MLKPTYWILGVGGSVTVGDDALVKAVRAALGKVPGVDLPNTKVDVQQGIAAIKKIDNRLVSGHQMGWD